MRQALLFDLFAYIGIVVVADFVALHRAFPGQAVAHFAESFALFNGLMVVVVVVFTVAAGWNEQRRRNDEDERDGRRSETTVP